VRKPKRPENVPAPPAPVERLRIPLLGVFVAALLVRALYIWELHHAPFFDLRTGDGNAYHDWASRIAAGDWIGQGVFYQAPLYPYFLAVIYKLLNDSTLIVRSIQVLLGAVSCTLLARAGIALFGRRGVIAGVLLAVYPPAIFLESQIEKSALITLFTTALLAILATSPDRMTPRRWIAAGVTLGLLALARENALLLTIPVLAWISFGPFQTRLRPSLLFIAGCAVILVPVGLRNLAAGGEFHLTTSQFGPNLYIGNHVGADGTYAPLVAGHGNVENEREDATRLAQQAEGRALTPSEVSGFWTRQALAFITSQPLAWMKLMGRKLGLTLNAAESPDTESQEVYAEWSLLLRVLSPFNFGILLALAMLGTVVTAHSWRRLWFLYAIAAVYMFGTALFYVIARYRFPLAPVLMLLAAAGLIEAIDAARARRWSKQLTAATVAAAIALLITYIPLIDRSAARAINYLSIAAALSKHPARVGKAQEFYEKILTEHPQWPPARYGLGLLLTQTGRYAEAIPHLRQAIAIWPEYSEAHYALGVAFDGIGRPSDAAREYGEAMRTRPQ
jgi:4-amino-4-deoxy-L-arabinose transferase-like glycosyltransferase